MNDSDLNEVANCLPESVSSDRDHTEFADARTPPPGKNMRGWIQSPQFDLTLFTLSPLAGLVVVLPALARPSGIHVWIAATYLIAIPHYVSSFSFYLGDQNLAYYRTRQATFFLGPVLIFFLVMGLRLTKIDAVVQAALYTWNVFHVSMQSVGILSIYRQLNGGAKSEGRFARFAILGVNGALAFLHIDRFPPIYDNLVKIHFPVRLLVPAFLCLAVFGLAGYVNTIRARRRRIRGPELSFLISSLVMFHPYLWVHELNLATYGMLMGHFLQYLGIVWLLNRRKYPGLQGSLRQRILSTISSNTPLLLLVLASIGTLFYGVRVGSDWLRSPISYTIIWNSLSLIHFYLDGFLWAFSNPFVRSSVGSYLKPPSHLAVT
jgi:hypothetical protein